MRIAVLLGGASMAIAAAIPIASSQPTTVRHSSATIPHASAVVAYRPPVRAPLVDLFRPPSVPWASGNRGVDYATRAGAPVHVAADGVVSFAGPVGGTLHVTVSHADGVRTSYSFLGSILVRRGALLKGGHIVGRAGERPLHFGARRGTTYIDPLSLFTSRAVVRLVPARRR